MATGRLPGTNYVSVVRWSKTLDAGVTALSGLDDASVPLTYSAGLETVYLNGALLARGSDYTATDGSTITLSTASVLNDIVNVFSTQPTSVTNAVLKSQVTAKGDVLVGSGSALVTNLPVGADGTTLVADSSQTTGLRYQGNFSSGKNLAYNSNFDIWQRGTSFTATGYTADRWYTFVGGTATVSQETSIVPTGSTYSAKILTGAASSYAQLYQAFEAQDVNDWCGQTITFSASVRALASFSGSANITIYTNTTANTMTGGTWTLAGTGTVTPSTSAFSRVSVSYAVPAGTKGIKVELNFTSAQASGTGLYWAQTQLEIGSVATTYSRGSATLQGELAACQRYYQRVTGTTANQEYATGIAYSTTAGTNFVFPHRVTMRIGPSAIDYSNIRLFDGVTTVNTTAITLTYGGADVSYLDAAVTSGLTQYRPYTLLGSSSSTYLGFSAEL